jgi:hypothetical protein
MKSFVRKGAGLGFTCFLLISMINAWSKAEAQYNWIELVHPRDPYIPRDQTLQSEKTNFANSTLLAQSWSAQSRRVFLSDMKVLNSGNVHGGVGLDKPYWGGPLIIAGTTFQKGLVLHPPEGDAPAFVEYSIGRNFRRFRARIGWAQQANAQMVGSMNLTIYGDGELLGSYAFPKPSRLTDVDVDIQGVSVLRLEVDNGGDGNNSDHAALGNARIE